MGSHTLSDDTTRIVTALRSLVQALRTGASEAERRTGLSSAQLYVLTKLIDAPAESVNALAHRVHAHQSSVSVVADALVRRGLVRRHPDPADRRRRLLEITPTGRHLIRRAPPTVQDALMRSISELPRPSRRTLASHLTALVATLGTAEHPALFLESDRRAR